MSEVPDPSRQAAGKGIMSRALKILGRESVPVVMSATG